MAPSFQSINWEYVTNHEYRVKYLMATNKINKIFALKLLLHIYIENMRCGLTILIQLSSQTYYFVNHARLCKSVLSFCPRCHKHRLINNRKFLQEAVFSFPTKFALDSNTDQTLSNLNDSWEIDFITRVRINHPFCYFVNDKDRNIFKDVSSSNFFINILCFVNIKTGFVKYMPLFTRKFMDVKIAVESFLNIFNLARVRLLSDKEGSFLRSEILSTNSKKNKELCFFASNEARNLEEKYNIRFSTHQSYRAYLGGHIKARVSILKLSFSCFSQLFLSYHQMDFLLHTIARVINDKPLGLFRQQTTNNTALNVVTPFNLMHTHMTRVNP